MFAKELKDEVVCRSFDGSDGSSDEGESSRSRSNSENNGLVSSAENKQSLIKNEEEVIQIFTMFPSYYKEQHKILIMS